MSIHNKEKYVENLWDWGFLRKYLGGFGIEPTDLDGVIERNGCLLLLEAKSPGVLIPRGQQIMFDHVVHAKCPHCGKETGLHDVLVMWGLVNQPQQMQMWRTHDTPIDANEAAIQKVVGAWYQQACNRPRP